MKRNNALKTIRLAVYIVLAVISFALVLLNRDIYYGIAHDMNMRALCVLLWLTFGVSFFFAILDFRSMSTMKKDFSELDYAVHTDTLSGLANRFGADSIIESYLDKPVPENFCCIMMDIRNLAEINELHGHITGNGLIRDFSAILSSAASDRCHVARNGGNKFLAIFEDAAQEDILAFSEALQTGVSNHNAVPGIVPLRYRTGIAFHEPASAGIREVTDMIALANRRLYEDRN